MDFFLDYLKEAIVKAHEEYDLCILAGDYYSVHEVYLKSVAKDIKTPHNIDCLLALKGPYDLTTVQAKGEDKMSNESKGTWHYKSNISGKSKVRTLNKVVLNENIDLRGVKGIIDWRLSPADHVSWLLL